jgi:hypothetical protein
MASNHLFTLLCDYAFENTDHKYGFMGVFQNIGIDSFPGSIARFHIAVGLTGDPGSKIEVRLAKADGEWSTPVLEGHTPETGSTELQHVTLTAGMTALDNFTFQEPGEYQILTIIDGVVIHSYPFLVYQEESEDGSEAT